MEKRIRPIKKLNYYIILGITLFQFTVLSIMCILCIISKYTRIFIHITNWSFFLSSIYLFSILACDTNLYLFSSKKLEKFNHFIRNTFSNIAFPYCFMITIGFWGILLIGIIIQSDTFTKSGTKITVARILFNLHLHLGITMIMITELLLTEREEVKLNWFSGIANTSIFIIYCIVVCVAKYKYHYYAYVFMENLNILWMIIGIMIYRFLVGCFFIYMILSNKINRKSFKVMEEDEDKNLLGNENEENCDLIPE